MTSAPSKADWIRLKDTLICEWTEYNATLDDLVTMLEIDGWQTSYVPHYNHRDQSHMI